MPSQQTRRSAATARGAAAPDRGTRARGRPRAPRRRGGSLRGVGVDDDVRLPETARGSQGVPGFHMCKWFVSEGRHARTAHGPPIHRSARRTTFRLVYSLQPTCPGCEPTRGHRSHRATKLPPSAGLLEGGEGEALSSPHFLHRSHPVEGFTYMATTLALRRA